MASERKWLLRAEQLLAVAKQNRFKATRVRDHRQAAALIEQAWRFEDQANDIKARFEHSNGTPDAASA